MTCCLCCCWPGRPGLATGGAFWLRWCCWPAGCLPFWAQPGRPRPFAPAIGDAFLSPFLTRQVTLALAEAGGDAARRAGKLHLPARQRARRAGIGAPAASATTRQPRRPKALWRCCCAFVKAGIFLVACLVLRGIVRALASLLRGMNAVPPGRRAERAAGACAGPWHRGHQLLGGVGCDLAGFQPGRRPGCPSCGAGVLNQTVLVPVFCRAQPVSGAVLTAGASCEHYLNFPPRPLQKPGGRGIMIQ